MKIDWKNVIERLKHWENESQKYQKAMDVFCNAFAPLNYPLILDYTISSGFIEGVANGNKEIEDWLSYYIYEARGMKGKATVKVGDKEYNFKKDKDVIKFFNDNYNI
jgi:hypothetical protein